MHFSSRLRSVLVFFFILVPCLGSSAFATVDDARDKAIAWLFLHQNIDGSWGERPETKIHTTAVALEGLRNAGLQGGPSYARGIAWLANAEAVNTDGLARQIMEMHSAGMNTSELVERLKSWRTDSFYNGNLYTSWWGAGPQYGGSFPDTSLALRALYQSDINGQEGPLIYAAWYFIVSKPIAGGCWDWGAGKLAKVSRIIPTAHNILASLVHGLYSYDYINWLKNQQQADGGFSDNGSSTVHETAMAYLAIAAVDGPADLDNAPETFADKALRFILDTSSHQPDGSWDNDPFLTSLALQTLPAPSTALTDSDNDGVPDGVEVVVGTDPNAKDSEWIANPMGDGPTATTVLKEAIVDQPFSYSLIANGGTAPYLWSIPAGGLPNGLSLNQSAISGTPTVEGSFNFTTSVVDQQGLTGFAPGQITVIPLSPSIDTDLDGMPSYFEIQNGFNSLNAADANSDADGDGLTNLDEYLLSTNPIQADTDSDGAGDGFEVKYGFDPLDPADGALDPDLDGCDNACEFAHGRNPLFNEALIPIITNTLLGN